MKSRREFVREAAFGAAGLAVGMNAHSYARIVGANNRVNFAVIGLHGRGIAHLECIRQNKNVMVSHVCDVDRGSSTSSQPRRRRVFSRLLRKRKTSGTSSSPRMSM